MGIARRSFVRAAADAAAISTLFATGLLGVRRAGAALPPQTFLAASPGEAIGAVLGTGRTPIDRGVQLDITAMVEMGDLVPLSVKTALARVESITIVAERNPNPVIAHYRLTPRLLPYLATRVRLADSGEVQALVKAEGGIHRATRDVAVAISGCGDSEPGPAPLAAQARPEGISIRTKREDDALTVRVLFSHPMDPPGRDPAGGPPVSGHYIQEVTAELNGETLLNGDWSAGVSRDPYLAFKILKARPGDIVRLSWSDTAGNCGSAEALVG